MREPCGDSAGENDPFAPAADALFAYLRDIFYAPKNASLDIESLPPAFRKFGKGLEYFGAAITEAKALTEELAAGNLDCALPPPENEIAAPLKKLHASLRHLTWQTQQVANGDYNQRVNFMGVFSAAFNNMIEQLRRRHKISLAEKTRLEMYVDLILENSPDPILLFDNQGKLTDTSFSWLKHCGVSSAGDVLGKGLWELFSPFVSERSMRNIDFLYKRVLDEKVFLDVLEEFRFSEDTSSIHFGIQIIPMLDSQGVSNGVMLILVDLTENVAALVDAERARELAEQASWAKSSFLAKMSHEIRTPLNAILGMAELALREDVPAPACEHINTIKQAGKNLLSIINDTLDFSKIETGKLEIIPEEYSFSSLIIDVINIIKTKVLESRLRFIVNLDSGIPDILYGDSIRIRQILLNILINAVKYTENGFVSLSVSWEKSAGKADGGADSEAHGKAGGTAILKADISDSGRGIKREEMEKLFEEFERLDLEHTRTIEGTGLGLAISRNLARAMNGRIDVRSEYGKGSTFTVILPQEIRKDKKIAAVKNPEEKKVLLYERRELCADSIIKTMENLGVYCKPVSTPEVFYDELVSEKYKFVFVAPALYDSIKKILSETKAGAKVVLLAEFGEAISRRNVSVLTMPVFSIPVAELLNGEGTDSAGRSSPVPAISVTAPGVKVLLVDDIAINLMVAEGLLQPYGMRVRLCRSGAEAIEELKRERHDLVFMDHMMPVMDGIETVFKIRALGKNDDYFKTVPIIALTANAISGIKEMFLRSGFNDFLSKPIDTVKLDGIIRKWIPEEKIKTSLPEKSGGFPLPDELNTKFRSIVGLDTEKGLSMSGGQAKNYLRTLAVFYEDGTEKTKEIGAALDAGDIPLFTVYVHALKSASANIGALKLSASAKALEDAGKNGDADFINTQTPVFLDELETLLLDIKALVEKETRYEKNRPANSEALKTGLIRLRAALNEFDSGETAAALDILRDFTGAPGYGEKITLILQKQLIGDYDTAAVLAGELLEKSTTPPQAAGYVV